MSKLRILVLVREGHVPPDTLDGVSDEEMDPWKAEFDVCETLRRLGHEVLPLGVYDDLAPIRKCTRRVSTRHHLHAAGRVPRRGHLRLRGDQLSGTDAAALHGMQPQGPAADQRQGAVEEGAHLSSHSHAKIHRVSPLAERFTGPRNSPSHCLSSRSWKMRPLASRRLRSSIPMKRSPSESSSFTRKRGDDAIAEQYIEGSRIVRGRDRKQSADHLSGVGDGLWQDARRRGTDRHQPREVGSQLPGETWHHHPCRQRHRRRHPRTHLQDSANESTER